MPLSKTLYRDIHTALLDRFSMSDLERLVRFHIDGERLDRIVPSRANLTEAVSSLLDHAEQQGWVAKLLDAAIIERPNITNFTALRERYQSESLPNAGGNMPNRSAEPAWQQQRLHDLERHIEQDQTLLAALEEEIRYETHPRRILGYRRDIQRQNESIADYQRQLKALNGAAGQTAAADTIIEKLAAMETQIAGMEQRLSSKLDAHQATLEDLLNKLSAEQRQVSDQFITLVDQGQLAQTERADITQLVQRALVDLRHMPNPSYWVRLENAVSEQTSVDGKLKLMIPLIPLFLGYEAELSTSLLPELRSLWRRLQARIGIGNE